jgi:hypothetical protein
MAYQELGTSTLDKAARFSAEWRSLGGACKSSESSYVAFHMSRLGISLPNKDVG